MPKTFVISCICLNTFSTTNLETYSPHELLFSRKPKLLLNLETIPDIKVPGTFKDYFNILNKRLQNLHKLLQDFKSKRSTMINKDGTFFQYNSGDLVHIISPLTSQLNTISRKVMIKYVGPVVTYRIIGAHNYLLMTLDGKILR